MEIITSVSNAKIQGIKLLLKDRDERWRRNEYVVEGVNIVDDMPKHLVKELYVLDMYYDKYSMWSVPCHLVSLKVMEAITDTVTPQGVIAIAKMQIEHDGAIGANSSDANKGISIVLDNLRDPGNVGTIIRTAAACGVNNIVIYGQVCDPYSPKSVRASMGGIFYVTVSKIMPDHLYALDMGGRNIYTLSDAMPSNYGIIVGSEAHGVSSELRMAAEEIISIPMIGRIESLNAGVSLAVALYHFTNVLSK